MLGLALKTLKQKGKDRIHRFPDGSLFPLRRPKHSILLHLRRVYAPAESIFHPAGLAEEGSEFVEVALFPVVEGVVVALGALHADSQENLRSGRRKGHRVRVVVEDESNRREVAGSALGRDQFAGKLIEGFFLANRLVDVGKERPASRGSGTDPQHVREKGGPPVGEALVLEKPFQKKSPPVHGIILEVSLDLLLARYAANKVDAQFPQVLEVVEGRARDKFSLGRVVGLEAIVKRGLCRRQRDDQLECQERERQTKRDASPKLKLAVSTTHGFDSLEEMTPWSN